MVMAAKLDMLSREQVKEQLAELGYTNVPNSVLDEFMVDLLHVTKQKKNYDSPKTRMHRVYYADDIENQEENEYINAYPDAKYEEVEEINAYNNHNHNRNHNHNYDDHYKYDDYNDYNDYDQDIIERGTIKRSRPHTTLGGSRYSHYGHNPKSQLSKKTDPVALYHKRNKTWKKDRFIKKMEKHKKPIKR